MMFVLHTDPFESQRNDHQQSRCNLPDLRFDFLVYILENTKKRTISDFKSGRSSRQLKVKQGDYIINHFALS